MNIELELNRARKDAETWRKLLEIARTKAGEEMALRGLKDAQERERKALKELKERAQNEKD